MSTSWNVWSVPPSKPRRSSAKTAVRRLRNPQNRARRVASLLLITERGGENESDRKVEIQKYGGLWVRSQCDEEKQSLCAMWQDGRSKRQDLSRLWRKIIKRNAFRSLQTAAQMLPRLRYGAFSRFAVLPKLRKADLTKSSGLSREYAPRRKKR